MVNYHHDRGDDDTAVSRARAGEGTENPENISNYNVSAGGKKTGLIIRWDGNGYDREDCWLRASVEDLVDLDTNL